MGNPKMVGGRCHVLRQRFLSEKCCLTICLLGLLAYGGCGGSIGRTVPVTGGVLADGKPVAGLTVQFNPVAGGRGSTGFTDPAGQFELRYNKDIRGAIPGRHHVTFSWSQDEPGQKMTEVQALVLELHSEESGTPYEVEITGPTRGLALEFTSPVAE